MNAIYKDRIETAIELVGEAINEDWDRERLKSELIKRYKERGIEPLKGLATPPDLIDKELATVYAVAKYGLGLDEDVKALDYEKKLERAAELLLEKGRDAREEVLALLGEMNSNVLSRIFRVVFTSVVLGFRKEEDLIKLLHKAKEAFPEQEVTVRKYAKFYIAFRVAEAIAGGEVRNKIEKEALKQSLSIRLGIPKVNPDDNYIASIAISVFKVNPKKLERVLKMRSTPRAER